MCIMLYTIVTDTKVYIYIYIYIHSLYSFYLRKYYEKCIIGKVIGIDIFVGKKLLDSAFIFWTLGQLIIKQKNITI